MFVFHPLSEPTRRSLIDGGLDPDAVAGIVRNAVTEDLMGGIDVTSTATIPADHRSTATFGARQDGVIAGLPVVAAVIETVCGDAASEFHATVADGARRRSRHEDRRGHRADPAAAHRRTHRAEPAVPPLGCRDRRPGAGPTHWRAPRPSCATPARPPRGCVRSRSTPCGAVAARTTGWGCPTWRS